MRGTTISIMNYRMKLAAGFAVAMLLCFTCGGGVSWAEDPDHSYEVADGTSQTESTVLTGSATVGLLKTGAGELILDAYNTYTGETQVNAGTVTLYKTGNTGTIYKGTTITATGSTSKIQGGGDVIGWWNGSVATINLTGGGTLHNTNSGNHFTVSATVNMNDGHITAAGNGSSNYGSYSFDKNINVTGGTNNTITAGKISFRTGTYDYTFIATGGNIDVAADSKLTIRSVIINGSNNKEEGKYTPLVKTGAGELVLDAYNDYNGETLVNGGTLTLNKVGSTGTIKAGNTIKVIGATSKLQGTGDVLGYGTNAVGSLYLNEGGTLYNTGTGSHITIGTDIYMNSGHITSADGKGNGTYGNYVFDNKITVQSGTDNNIATTGSISFRNYNGLNKGGGIIEVADNAVLSVNSVIKSTDGTVGFQKTGDGTLILSKANTYSGTTAISGGTLKLTQAGTVGSGSVINSGVFDVADLLAVTVGGSYTQNAAGVLRLGIDKTNGVITPDVLTINGDTNLDGTLLLYLTGEAITMADLESTFQILNSPAGITGTFSSVAIDPLGNSLSDSMFFVFDRDTGYLTLAIPEPSTWILLLLSIAGLFYTRRRFC